LDIDPDFQPILRTFSLGTTWLNRLCSFRLEYDLSFGRLTLVECILRNIAVARSHDVDGLRVNVSYFTDETLLERSPIISVTIDSSCQGKSETLGVP
jgi:hypothetical protein